MAKQITGYNQPVGAAKNWPINTTVPVVGGVVVTNENPTMGHVAVIRQIIGTTLILEEGNYSHCQHTLGRELEINDPHVLGFWRP